MESIVRWCRFILCLVCIALAACTSTPTRDGKAIQVDEFSADQLGQTDINRLSTVSMRENIESLLLLADKLYKRNPIEWKKVGTTSHDEALRLLNQAFDEKKFYVDIGGISDIDILRLSFDPEYAGDRVALFCYGLYDMLLAAHDGKTEFYLVDALDEGKIYNAARNVETAMWLLNTKKNQNQQLLLLSNELTPHQVNLTFDRELSKIVARLDLESMLIAEKYQRAGVGYLQGLFFINFLPVR